MRGLLVTSDFPPSPGGVARFNGELCAFLPTESVVVLAPRFPGDRESDARQAYRVIRVRVPVSPHPASRLMQILGFLWHALRTIRRENIRSVHIGHLHLGPIGAAAKWLLGTPYVLYLHGGEMAPYLRFRLVRAVLRVTIEGAHTVIVNSHFTRRHYEALGMRHPRTEVLAPCVSTTVFRPDLDAGRMRTRFGLNGDPVVLTVGRLVERKGHDIVIRALPALKQRLGPIRYLIAGTGAQEPRLRALAAEVGCGDDVVFTGYVNDQDLPFLYAACDIFVMPSRALPGRDGLEGYGIVFLEAAASGRPSVGGRSGGVDESVLDDVTGILTNPQDPHAVADSIAGLLQDPDRARRLGRAGREHAVEREQAWARAIVGLWGTG